MFALFSTLQQGAVIAFSAALVLIVILFLVKSIEARRERRFAEGARMHADRGALVIKHWLERGEWYIEQTPWFIGAITRYGVHVGALGYARLAHDSAEYAHGLADLVSHKHRFERKETKSEYLKQVSERTAVVAEPALETMPTPEPASVYEEPVSTLEPTPTPPPAPESKKKKGKGKVASE
ncbi:MAG: hypothetical protein WA021_04035 [Minisyncoccia bacterium]